MARAHAIKKRSDPASRRRARQACKDKPKGPRRAACVSAQLHELPQDSEEFMRLEAEFISSAYEETHQGVKRSAMGVRETKVLKIERIENAQLWVSLG